MKRVKQQLIVSIALILFVMNYATGQRNNRLPEKKNESFLNIPDDTIKREIASFCHKVSDVDEDLKPINVNKIALKKCSDSFAFFEKGNIIASEIILSITIKKGEDINKINEIFYIHYKYGFALPDSVFNDLSVPVPCTEFTHKGKPLSKSSYKVFQSEDRRRIYVYLLNQGTVPAYEVTWVIVDDEYYTRIIDEF